MDYSRLVLSHPNLQSFWRLDEASGDAIDLGPGGHDGTVGASTDYSQDPIMEASQSSASMGFGATGKSVEFGDNYDFAGTAAFSYVAWVNRSAATGVIMQKRGAAGTTGTTDGWSVTQNGALQRRVAATSVSAAPSTSVADGVPCMIAGTYDGATMRAYVYVAGALAGYGDQADSRSLIDTGGTLTVGKLSDLTTIFFGGTISDVAIYDAALPQAFLTRLHLVGHRQKRAARIAF